MGRRGSFAKAVAFRRTLLRRIALVVAVLVAFDSFRTTFLASYAVNSTSMVPTFAPGDRFFSTALPFGSRTVFGKLPALSGPRRGDIVLATLPGSLHEGFWTGILDSFVRLVTFQRISTIETASGKAPGSMILKRVIAIPGDTILMEGGIYRIMTAGSGTYRSENEVSSKVYAAGAEAVIPGWIDGLPGSGRMEARTLDIDEYYLAGDNRKDSSDSRLWGPVHSGSIVALVLFRFWPLSRQGRS